MNYKIGDKIIVKTALTRMPTHISDDKLLEKPRLHYGGNALIGKVCEIEEIKERFGMKVYGTICGMNIFEDMLKSKISVSVKR